MAIHPKGGSVRAHSTSTHKTNYPALGDESGATELADARISRTVPDEVTLMPFGTGRSTFDHDVCRDKTIAAGASVTYDIYTGTDLTGAMDEPCAFRRVRYLEIALIDGGDTSGVRIGGAAANEFIGWFAASGDKHDIFPGGPSYRAGSPVGKVVTSSTKNIKIENLGAVIVTVRIAIAGAIFQAGEWMGPLGLTYP